MPAEAVLALPAAGGPGAPRSWRHCRSTRARFMAALAASMGRPDRKCLARGRTGPPGRRLSRRVEHVRASMEDRHEVEVVLSHLPLDPVERRQRVVGSVHSVMQRSEMHQGAPLLRGRGAASLHASIAAARVATRPSCSAAACSHRPDATRGPLGQGSACRAFERCGGATVGSRSPTPTALEKLRCVFSVTRKHPWRTPRGLIRHTLQAEIGG